MRVLTHDDPITEQRIRRLDSLRGLAAVAVVFHHCIHISDPGISERVLNQSLSSLGNYDFVGRFVLSFAAGGMAVYVFFILSGCVLHFSFSRIPEVNIGSMIGFIVRRCFRLYPVAIVSVILIAAFSYLWLPQGRGEPYSLEELFLNVLLLNNSVNGATWTIQAELLMVPILMAVGIAFRMFGVLAIVGFIFFAQTFLFYGAPVFPVLLSVTAPAFGLGMFAAFYTSSCKAIKIRPWMVYSLLLSLPAIRFWYPIGELYGIILILFVSTMLIIFLIKCIDRVSLLDNIILTKVGDLSYSIYLMHVLVAYQLYPIYEKIFGLTFPNPRYILHGLTYSLIVLLLTLPIAAAVERYVEKPFMAFGKMLALRVQVRM